MVKKNGIHDHGTITLTDKDFSPEKSAAIKHHKLKLTALRLASALPKYGKASDRVKQLLKAHQIIIARNLNSVDKATFVNFLILLAAPKRMKIEVMSSSGKNAKLIKQYAARYIDAPKHVMQQAAKKVREQQGTSRAERSDVLERETQNKTLSRLRFFKELNIMLDHPEDRVEILKIISEKDIKLID